MKSYYTQEYLLLLALLLPVVTGAFRYRIMNSGIKTFFYFTISSFIGEILAFYAAIHYHNNLVVYNVLDIAGLFLITLYFNRAIPCFQKRNAGLFIGIASVLIWAANIYFLQPINTIGDNFLSYESFAIVVLSGVSLSSFLKRGDKRKPAREVNFWIPVILMSSSCITYLLFTLIRYYLVIKKTVPDGIIFTLLLVNIITGIAFALIFFLYSKKLKIYE